MPSVVLPRIDTPAMLFVGVSTGGSFINRLFPVWAEILQLGPVRLHGVDIPVNDTRESYRRTVEFIRDEPLVRGALVTTHKINILQYARDLFERFDPYADLLGEVSSISKDEGRLVGHAKDPISSGLAFEDAAGADYWRDHPDAEALILGSGGSALAFGTYLLEQPPDNRPARIILTGRTPARLDHLTACLQSMDTEEIVECRHVTGSEDHDHMLSELSDWSLVANATGMGKDRPGSPITDRAPFPEHGFVWEFNYRGRLDFLRQARAQAAARCLTVEDGWTYFLHGWSQVVVEVFHLDMHRVLFERLRQAADELRQSS